MDKHTLLLALLWGCRASLILSVVAIALWCYNNALAKKLWVEARFKHDRADVRLLFYTMVFITSLTMLILIYSDYPHI